MSWTARDITRTFHITNRRLQWWDEQAIVRSNVIGHTRHYTTQAVMRLLVVDSLRRRGVSLMTCRKAIDYLHRNDLRRATPAVYLVGNVRASQNYYTWRVAGFKLITQQELEREVTESMGPTLVINLRQLREKIQRAEEGREMREAS
jgi:DNA-binding transcriptional MerR regulator